MEVAPRNPAPEASPFPLIAADLVSATLTPLGTCVDCNDAWHRVFGRDGLWSRLPDEDIRFATDYASEAARGHLVTHQVFLVEASAHAPVTPVLLNFHPIRLPADDAGRYHVMVTGEVLREPVSWALEQTRRRRMEVVGQMAMGVAHDFNNLLTTVLGHAELLRQEVGGTSPSANESLRSLTRAALDGAALVGKIQSYLRHEKRERFESVDLAALVSEVVTLTRPYWYNEPRRQGVAIELDADLSPVPPVQGYPTELREVLVNLVLNAVQAMPAGGSLLVTCERDAVRNAAIVEVGDSGVGMPKHVLRRIFEPLYTTKGESGTGMGLAVALGIIQEHGGRIEVESETGQGSVFRLVLPYPVSGAREAPPASAPEATRPDASPVKNMGDARPALRLLVVDDEPMVRTITTRLMSLRGHEVEAVHGGLKALEAMEVQRFDCVVTDLSMPEMSGRELAAEIATRHAGTPVVLLTGDTDPEVDSRTVADVVRKPFDANELDEVIRRAAGGQA